jgi:hypothetical protein
VTCGWDKYNCTKVSKLKKNELRLVSLHFFSLSLPKNRNLIFIFPFRSTILVKLWSLDGTGRAANSNGRHQEKAGWSMLLARIVVVPLAGLLVEFSLFSVYFLFD